MTERFHFPLAAFPAGRPPLALPHPAACTDPEAIMAAALYACFVGPDLSGRLPLVNAPAPIQRRFLDLARVAIRVAPTLEAANA